MIEAGAATELGVIAVYLAVDPVAAVNAAAVRLRMEEASDLEVISLPYLPVLIESVGKGRSGAVGLSLPLVERVEVLLFRQARQRRVGCEYVYPLGIRISRPVNSDGIGVV